MRRALAGIPLALLLVGCGSQASVGETDAADSRPASGRESIVGSSSESAGSAPSYAPPDGLKCRTGERVGTAGGYLAEYPDGVDDPQQLVEEKSTAEEPWVLVGRKAYALRPDGTAFEVHDVVKGPKGWFLHGYEACAE